MSDNSERIKNYEYLIVNKNSDKVLKSSYKLGLYLKEMKKVAMERSHATGIPFFISGTAARMEFVGNGVRPVDFEEDDNKATYYYELD